MNYVNYIYLHIFDKSCKASRISLVLPEKIIQNIVFFLASVIPHPQSTLATLVTLRDNLTRF